MIILPGKTREILKKFMREPVENYPNAFADYYENAEFAHSLKDWLIAWNIADFSDFYAHTKIPPTYYNAIVKLALRFEGEEDITEDFFWDVIGKLDFAKDLDEGRVGEELSNGSFCTLKQASKIHNMSGIFYNKLENAMDKYIEENDLDYDDVIGLGDDGLNDLLSHIIGLGKEEYFKCLNNIKLLSTHAKSEFDTVEGYTESFDYAFQVLDND